ncbi:MAG TPA: type II toxin-antitoxin system VapC family toxin [Bryobacteraceae bacterium]|nr:type II toxin-antitoxin system VapC family toxin [Bryobacteraceae bacterium]
MSRVYWDSMLFVYWFEDNPLYAKRIDQIQTRMAERGDILCTSVFTIGEVLTGLYRQAAAEIATQIREAFRSPQIELIPFSEATAESYARIRGTHRVSPADAIHLASAAEAAIDLLLTNDRSLQKLVIPGIQFIAGLDVSVL